MQSPVVKFINTVTLPHRRWFLFGSIAVIIASAGSTAVGYLFKLIVDAVTTNAVETAVFLAVLYPFILFAIQLLYRLSGYAIAHFTTAVAKTATDTLSEHLVYQPQSYFSDRFAGAVANKVKNVTGALDQIIPDIIWSQLDTLVSFVVAFVLLCTVDLKVGFCFLSLVCVLALINKHIAPRKAKISKLNAEAGSKLQGSMVDVISNSSAVRHYVQYKNEQAGLALLSAEKQRLGLSNWLFTEKVLLINVCAIFVFVLLMFYFLVDLWSRNIVTSGDFILVATLVSHLSGTMLFIGRAVNATARSLGELREGLDEILVPYNIVDNNNAKPLRVTMGRIVLDRVRFSYDDKVSIFSDLSLSIEAHEKVGVVGTSGAGKTTLVSLLLREHDVAAGSICIDGQNITAVTQESLRRSIAVVPQDPSLFHRSIYENIAYGNRYATEERVVEAARLAHAADFIEALPDGYRTMVGERGVKLSGGQKQRIAMARAIIKDAPILILDEATSALDSESEKYIQEALRKLMEGRTVLAIAHRLSTLKEMDRIIVLHQGVVVESGTHEALITRGGIYARLWSHQANGFIVE